MTPIPVTERLPENEDTVLVYDANVGWRSGSYLGGSWDWDVHGIAYWYKPTVTHWMPLPPNPNSSG